MNHVPAPNHLLVGQDKTPGTIPSLIVSRKFINLLFVERLQDFSTMVEQETVGFVTNSRKEYQNSPETITCGFVSITVNKLLLISNFLLLLLLLYCIATVKSLNKSVKFPLEKQALVLPPEFSAPIIKQKEQEISEKNLRLQNLKKEVDTLQKTLKKDFVTF